MTVVVLSALPPGAGVGISAPTVRNAAGDRPAGWAGYPGLGDPGHERGDDRTAQPGLPLLPLAFGEAGLPAHPALRDALAAASGYGPVAGHPAPRQAAAGTGPGAATSPGQVVCGPGSKPLLFALLLTIGGGGARGRAGSAAPPKTALTGIRPFSRPPLQGGRDTRPTPWPLGARHPGPAAAWWRNPARRPASAASHQSQLPSRSGP